MENKENKYTDLVWWDGIWPTGERGKFYVLRHTEIVDDDNLKVSYSFTVDDGAYAPNPKTNGQDYVQVFLEKIFEELENKPVKDKGEGSLSLSFAIKVEDAGLDTDTADRFGALLDE